MQERPTDDRRENRAVSCVQVYNACAVGCSVVSKEVEDRPVVTCRRRKVKGLARVGRSGVIRVTKFADILKTPVEKYVVCRHRRRIWREGRAVLILMRVLE